MNSQNYKYTNQLINESSPYLLQHAHNPVNWYPWGEKALAKAKKENKPMIISIGYAACHWCHVMEHESFEDKDVAKIMNENFIAVKVDREERPDIDQVYMSALQLITGSGGWPLNCITLPDARPIYAITYFPKLQWMSVLKQISDYIRQNPVKADSQATIIVQGILSSDILPKPAKVSDYTPDDLDRIFNAWELNIDFVEGGNKGAPKFPLPIDWQFLLSYYHISKNKHALKAVTTTLDKMGNGGIYDHIGGGFARYSVDAYWKVPHFEKMLYDNAQLVSLYSRAYKLTHHSQYKEIVKETLLFVKRELTSEQYGFYSSLDADTEKEEGKFYVWTKNEVKKLLRENSDIFIDYFNITDQGNWEKGNNILFTTLKDEDIAARYKITLDEFRKRMNKTKEILLKERMKRTLPGLDDKILTSWNALMLKGYVDAFIALKNQEYLKTAINNGLFISENLKSNNNRLDRNYKNNKATINGFLDDYSFTIEAFISLYMVTSDENWINQARQLTEYSINHFYDIESDMFFYTSDIDPGLIARKKEITDNVIPSANSQMAKNLYILGHYLNIDGYIEKSKKMVGNIKNNILSNGHFYANWNILISWFAMGKPDFKKFHL